MTYADIHGFEIPYLAADPSNPTEGEIWYNSTSNKLKFYNGSSTQTVTAS